jgi:hypothetical protein
MKKLAPLFPKDKRNARCKAARPAPQHRLVRPPSFDPSLPEWRQVQLELRSLRRAVQAMRRLRRVDPDTPFDFLKWQRKASELRARLKELAKRHPPPKRSAAPPSHRLSPAPEISRRDLIRRAKPEATTGPPAIRQRPPAAHERPRSALMGGVGFPDPRKLPQHHPRTSAKRQEGGLPARPLRQGVQP